MHSFTTHHGRCRLIVVQEASVCACSLYTVLGAHRNNLFFLASSTQYLEMSHFMSLDQTIPIDPFLWTDRMRVPVIKQQQGFNSPCSKYVQPKFSMFEYQEYGPIFN